MNRITSFALLTALAVMSSPAMAQLAIAPEYGTLTTATGSIVFTDDGSAGDLVVLDTAANSGSILTEVTFDNVGAIGFLGGTNWLFGMSSDSEAAPGEVFIFDAATATNGDPIANLNDVRDLAVIDQGDRVDALVADRANDTVHLITDVLGTPAVSDITPSSIAGNVGIQGVVALSESLYFLYDELPEGGFGEDDLIVVEGSSTDAATTRVSWNEIGSAGAGLNTDELSVDFHNGIAVRQPDESTIVAYLSNFGAFSENQVIEVTWTDSGSGFDFSAPTSRVLVTEPNLFDAISENNGDFPDPAAILNSRGVAILPGETAADDQLVIWVDDSDTGDTFMVLYDISGETYSLFGNGALETVLETTRVQNWLMQ